MIAKCPAASLGARHEWHCTFSQSQARQTMGTVHRAAHPRRAMVLPRREVVHLSNARYHHLRTASRGNTLLLTCWTTSSKQIQQLTSDTICCRIATMRMPSLRWGHRAKIRMAATTHRTIAPLFIFREKASQRLRKSVIRCRTFRNIYHRGSVSCLLPTSKMRRRETSLASKRKKATSICLAD